MLNFGASKPRVRGGPLDPHLLWGQIFPICMQLSAKNGQLIGSLCGWRSRLGNPGSTTD